MWNVAGVRLDSAPSDAIARAVVSTNLLSHYKATGEPDMMERQACSLCLLVSSFLFSLRLMLPFSSIPRSDAGNSWRGGMQAYIAHVPRGLLEHC